MRRLARLGAAMAGFVLSWGTPSGAMAQDTTQKDGEGPVYVPSPVGKPKDTSPGSGRRVAGAPPVYIPPTIGEAFRLAGGGVRGSGRQASLHLLAPDHVGLTTFEQPTLYWYLADESTAPVEITLIDGTTVKPLIEFRVSAPAPAGVHAVHLADHDVRLTPEKDYKWSVSIVNDPDRRSRDFSASAYIRRRELPSAVQGKLAIAASQGHAVFVYADNGIWYDAIASVSARIEAAPDDPEPRDHRAALLEQVGLSEVAAYDLEQGHAAAGEAPPAGGPPAR